MQSNSAITNLNLGIDQICSGFVFTEFSCVINDHLRLKYLLVITELHRSLYLNSKIEVSYLKYNHLKIV